LIDGLLAESEVRTECISEYNGAEYLFGALASRLNPVIYGGVQIFKFEQEGYKFQAKWRGDKTKKSRTPSVAFPTILYRQNDDD